MQDGSTPGFNLGVNLGVNHYCRIPADSRDLNYGKYFSEGASALSTIEEYNSDNTHQINLEETKQLLLKLEGIRRDCGM